MKKIVTFLLGVAAIATTLSTQAQQSTVQMLAQVKAHDQRLKASTMRLLRNQPALESGQKKRSASRLIAEAYAMPGTSNRDTVHHYYSSMA